MLNRRDIPRDTINAILERIPVIKLNNYKRAIEHKAKLRTRISTHRKTSEKARKLEEKLASFKQHYPL